MRPLGTITGLLAAAVLALLALASPASGGSIDRVQVGAGRSATAGFPPGLSLVLASPREYAAAGRNPDSGRWVGPRYHLRSDPSVAGQSAIEWSVAFDNTAKSHEAAALAAKRLPFVEDQRGAIAVPHVVAGRDVGTIQGFYVLAVAANTEANARAEAVLGFPLGQGVFVVVRFVLPEPPSDEYHVGGVLPTSYNRGQAFIALAGVRLEGNLAPALVSIRADRRTRRVAGLVLDGFRHRVIGAPVALERRAGSSWRRVAVVRTNARGSYAFRSPARGVYRAVATVGAASAASRTVAVRRR